MATPSATTDQISPSRKGPPTGFLTRIRSFSANKAGTAAIEFAIVGSVFFMMLFGMLETGLNFIANRSLDAAVDEVGRMVRTGQIRSGGAEGMNKEEFRAEFCALATVKYLFQCEKFQIIVQETGAFAPPTEPERDSDGNLQIGSLNDRFEPGGRLTLNLIRVSYDYPTVLDWSNFGVESWGGGTRLMVAVAAFQNEP